VKSFTDEFHAVAIEKLNYIIAQWKPKIKIRPTKIHTIGYSRKETESRSVP